MLTCRKDSGIKSPADFRGKTLGVWFYGNEYPFLSWMSQLGIPTKGGSNGVNVLKQGFNVDPILQKQAECVSTMTYNEYWQVVDAGLSPSSWLVMTALVLNFQSLLLEFMLFPGNQRSCLKRG